MDLESTQRLRGLSQSSTRPVQHDYGFSYVKIIFVGVLFLLSMISFVTQTELTSILYSEYHFHEPVLLLYLTHGSWWILWPLQFVFIALYKASKRYFERNTSTRPWKGFRRAIASSIKAQHRNVLYTAELTANHSTNNYQMVYNDPKKSFKHYSSFFESKAVKYIFRSSAILSVILNVAGVTWYIAMGMSTGADVTAIYNCSAFTAYVFGIFLLGDAFSLMKASSVVVAIGGVFMVAYLGGGEASGNGSSHRFLGNIIIFFGAILYGLYEVIYKKMACPPSNEVSARRQATFSNFVMCFIGLSTFLILTPPMLFVHLTGIHRFDVPASVDGIVIMTISIFANQIFSVAFLGLMSLTSPVFSSVASLLTILLVGVFEYIFRGVIVTPGQFGGYFFIMVGFALLTYCSWNEISEEDRDDELIETDSESMFSSHSSVRTSNNNSSFTNI